ncbi:MAG TPA: hypothetical protein VK139_05150 [Microbacteriaceae bacterium]|nr:hypothetical protein [Microbacteriaceae bacterium]
MQEWATLIWLGIVVLVLVTVAVTSGLGRSGSNRRHGGGGMAAFGVIDDLFHPSAKETRIIQEEQFIARAPMPSPHDKPFDGKRIRIELPAESSESPPDSR